MLALNPDAVELFKKANGRSEPQGGRSPSAVPCTWKGPVGGGLVNRSPRRPVLTQATADGPLAAFLSCERLAANAWCSDTVAAPPRGSGEHPSRGRALPEALTVPCLARSHAGRGRGRPCGRGGPAAAHRDGLSREQSREGPAAKPVRAPSPHTAGLVLWGPP